MKEQFTALKSEIEKMQNAFQFAEIVDKIEVVLDEFLNKSYDEIERTELHFTMIFSLYDYLLQALIALDSLEKGLKVCNQAISFANKHTRSFDVANILKHKGVFHLRLSNYSIALELFQESLHYALSNNDVILIAMNYNNIAICYRNLGDYYEALEHYKKALYIAEKQHHQNGIALCLGNIASIHHLLSEYEVAIEFYHKSLKVHQESNNFRGVGLMNNNIGTLHFELNHFEEAEEYFNQFLETAKKLDNMFFFSVAYTNLAQLRNLTGDIESAIEFATKSLEYSQNIGDKEGVTSAFQALTISYTKLEQFEKILPILHQMEEIALEIKNKNTLASCYKSLGAYFANKKNKDYLPQKAKEYFSTSISIYKELSEAVKIADVLEEVAEIHYEFSEFKEAFEVLKEQQEISQKVNIQEKRQIAEQYIFKRKIELSEKERLISTSILQKVLPIEIAEKLIHNESVDEFFPNVSILFADIVGFTPLATQMNPKDLLRTLTIIFEAFDSFASVHGCVRIKTIGDAYLAVAGLPTTSEDHSQLIVKLAKDILQFDVYSTEAANLLPEGSKIRFRIGLHCGAVSAGIVGKERFQYDIYGDSVNIAARMETHGEIGKIHISEAFKNSLDGDFTFKDRGILQIKGKGEMHTYFLE